MRTSMMGAAFMVGAVFACHAAGAAAPAKVGASDTQLQMNAVAEAMQMVLPVKQSVASYRLSHDGFPASNEEAGIPPPMRFASNTVKRVAIGPDGVIDVVLTAASGVEDGVIRFHPDYAPQSGGGDVHWTCASASYANIGDLTGGTCAHTSQP